MTANGGDILEHRDLPLVEQTSDYDARYSWRLQTAGNRLVLAVAGRVAQSPSRAFAASADAIIADLSARRVVIDFAGCEYIASGALSYLVRFFKAAVGHGGHVLAVSPNDHVRGLMQVLGIDAFLLAVDDDATADKYFEAQDL